MEFEYDLNIVPSSHKQNKDLTILNATYRNFVEPETDKYRNLLTLVYKDPNTGLKYKNEIVDPYYRYFIANPDKRVDYNRLFVNKENVQEFVCKYNDIEKEIAKRLCLKEYYFDNIRNGNRRENRKLHLHPDVFNSDKNIEDFYRAEFARNFINRPCKITKSYLDIEVDSKDKIAGDFPEPGEAPVNSVSFINEETKEVYVFLLKTKSNPQIAEFEEQVKNGSIFSEFEQFIHDTIGSEKISKYDINFKYNFLFYDEEAELNLIADVFAAINYKQPDFLMAWNMGFDIPYLIERIKILGGSPEDIIAHKDFDYKYAQYFVDERNKNEYAERGDYALISSYTVYIDQMIQYASRRKGQNKKSYRLDDIGELETGVKKLDYKHITSSIIDLPYASYKTFVFYNIIDTIVQYCIEKQLGDIDFLFNKALMNNTRYSKVHRQTVYLANRAEKVFEANGYIIGNNANKFAQPPEDKFAGAYVADPSKLKDEFKVIICGNSVFIFENLVNFDYSSLYPNICRQFNIASNTQIGMLIINEKVHDKENIGNLDHWTRGGAFLEDVQSGQWLEICSRWFNLPNYTEMYNKVVEFFTKKAIPTNGFRNVNMSTGLKEEPVKSTGKYFEAIVFEDNRRVVNEKYIPHNLNNEWEELRNHVLEYPNQQFCYEEEKPA